MGDAVGHLAVINLFKLIICWISWQTAVPRDFLSPGGISLGRDLKENHKTLDWWGGEGRQALLVCGDRDRMQLTGLIPVVPLPLCFAGDITGL